MKKLLLFGILVSGFTLIGQGNEIEKDSTELENWINESEKKMIEYVDFQRNSPVYDFKEGDNDLIHTKGLLQDIFYSDSVKEVYGKINPKINFLLIYDHHNDLMADVAGIPFFEWIKTLHAEDYPEDKFIMHYSFSFGTESLAIERISDGVLIRKIDFNYDNVNDTGEYQNLRSVEDTKFD